MACLVLRTINLACKLKAPAAAQLPPQSQQAPTFLTANPCLQSLLQGPGLAVLLEAGGLVCCAGGHILPRDLKRSAACGLWVPARLPCPA